MSPRTDRRDEEKERPLVVVAVGTDHHPFNRVVGWVDRWLARGGADRAECVMQHGTSTAPRWGTAAAYLEHGELTALLGRATVVVCHGGPATIAECRRYGKLPIVVPRRPEHGEHVDDHQVLFSTRLADKKLVHVATSEEQLVAMLDDALADPGRFAVADEGERPIDVAVRKFEQLVAELGPGRSGR